MADLFFPEVDVNQRATALGLEILPASFGEGFSAAFEETLTRNPLPSALRATERARYRDGRYVDEFGNEQAAPAAPAKMLPPDEANARYGIAGKLKFDAPTPEPIAENLFRLKTRELELQDIRRRADAGIGTALTAGLVGSLLDPLNVGLAFVPVVGPARMAAMTSRIGVGGARATTGAIEGAVGAMLVEPIVLGVAREEQADYTAVDSLMNLAFGTAIGGGLHFGAGYIGDRVRGREAAKLLPRLIDDLPQQDQAALLRTAVAQLAEGRQVDVSAVLSAAQPAAQVVYRGVKAEGQASSKGALYVTPTEATARAYAGADGKVLSGSLDEGRVLDLREFPPVVSAEQISIRLADEIGEEATERAMRHVRTNTAEQMDVYALLRSADAIAALKDAGFDTVKYRQLVGKGETESIAVLNPERVRFDGGDTAKATAEPSAAELVAQSDKEATLRTAVDKAHERPVDPADQRASAAAEQRVLDEANVKSLDDEAARIQEEVTELEKYAPEDEEPSQAVKDAAKEASLFTKAWRAAAACGLRKS